MNRNLAAAASLAAVAVAAAAAAAALIVPRTAAAAGDITLDTAPFVSGASRADVRGEARQGTQPLRGDTDSYPPQALQPRSGLTPAQVRSEYKSSRDQVEALTGEDSGSQYLRSHPANPAAVMGGPSTPMTDTPPEGPATRR